MNNGEAASYLEISMLDSYITLCFMIYSKYIKSLNIKYKSIKVVNEKMR